MIQLKNLCYALSSKREILFIPTLEIASSLSYRYMDIGQPNTIQLKRYEMDWDLSIKKPKFWELGAQRNCGEESWEGLRSVYKKVQTLGTKYKLRFFY